MSEANGRPAVKLSDNPGKAMGIPREVARYLRVFGTKGRVEQPVTVDRTPPQRAAGARIGGAEQAPGVTRIEFAEVRRGRRDLVAALEPRIRSAGKAPSTTTSSGSH